MNSKKNLLFTSAGKYCNINEWLSGSSFDIFVVYYGNEKFEYANDVQYLNYRKGGKFQNLFYVYNTSKNLLTQYDAIMVIDDDIKISGINIDKLFEIRSEFNITILQPSFSHEGKISHSITGMHPFSKLRYTNFVEVTCPLFSASYLFKFLDGFDSRANGGGVDFWFCSEANNRNLHIAIVDEIFCTNPHDRMKNNQREIDFFQSRDARNANWKTVRMDLGLKFSEGEFITKKTIYLVKFHQLAVPVTF